jgi:hypothetical protein
LIALGSRQAILHHAVRSSQLLQADLAIVIGVDPLENLFAHFFVPGKRTGKKLFLAQKAVLVLIEVLHNLCRTRRSVRIRPRALSALRRIGRCRQRRRNSQGQRGQPDNGET